MPKMLDPERARRGIEEFLRGLGHDPDTETELARTAERVVDAWTTDLLAGEDLDVEKMLLDGSGAAKSGEQGLVVLRNLATIAVCPHHLLPAVGSATVIYIPGERIAGLGTIARLVDAYSRRLVLQEEIGDRVARALVEYLGARGALCRLAMMHTCLVARGERKHDARIETLALAGTFRQPGPDREIAIREL